MERDELAAWLRLSLTPGVGNLSARRLLAAFGLPADILRSRHPCCSPAAVQPGQRVANHSCGLRALCWTPPGNGSMQQPARESGACHCSSGRPAVSPGPARNRRSALDALPHGARTFSAAVGSCTNALLGLWWWAAAIPRPKGGERPPICQGPPGRWFDHCFWARTGYRRRRTRGRACSGRNARCDTGHHRCHWHWPGPCLPRQHLDLARRIAAQGILVSEYPLGTPPLAANFPNATALFRALPKAPSWSKPRPHPGH